MPIDVNPCRVCGSPVITWKSSFGTHVRCSSADCEYNDIFYLETWTELTGTGNSGSTKEESSMHSAHVRKTLENAIELVEAYERTKDASLLDMVRSLIQLAIEDLDSADGIPSQLIPYIPVAPQDFEKSPLAPIVVMYMAAPVDPPSGFTQPRITISGDTVSITPGLPATSSTCTTTNDPTPDGEAEAFLEDEER